MLAGCFSVESTRKTPYYLQPPPGCVAINDTLWFDKNESTNMDWLEYLYWIARVYGEDHELYLAALPDTTVWKNFVLPEYGEPFIDLTNHYLRHPAYYDYPVVGISQQQAMAYSQWRSDRVYEMILVKYGVLVPNLFKQTPENHFTIERFQRGEFEIFHLPDPYLHYPVFRLPEPGEIEAAMIHDDSVQHHHRCVTTRCRRCNSTLRRAELADTSNIRWGNLPLLQPSREPKCEPFRQYRIMNLRDNAWEWLAQPGKTTEGDRFLPDLYRNTPDSITAGSPNAFTGFRNVATWKLFLHDTIIGEPVTDIDGNTYKTIRLANNLWMAENLRTTRLNDSTTLDLLQADVEWVAAANPAYCWNPDTMQWPQKVTGAYYNRYAMETGKLCPVGWRVPSKQDWESISDIYGGVTGGALKVTGFSWWEAPNRGATNATGFSAYPTGTRFPKWGFSHMRLDAFWWSTTRESERFYYTMALSHRKKVYQWMLSEANHGVAVRCVQNAGE